MNLFAANGYINYGKNTRIYIELIKEAPINYPSIYQCLKEKDIILS